MTAVSPAARTDGSTLAPARGRFPRSVRLLLCGFLLVRSAGFAYPFLGYLVADDGRGITSAGLVLTGFGLGWAAGQVLCGRLNDRFGGRTTLTGAMVVSATAIVMLTQVHTFVAILVWAAVVGLAYDAPRPVLGAAIADLIPDEETRARADTWRFGWVTNIGAAVCGGAGAVLLGRVGIEPLFWANATACLLFAGAVWLRWPASPARHVRTPRPPARTARIRGPFRVDRRLLLFASSSLATLTALMGVFSVLPLIMTERGLSGAAYGTAQFVNALAALALTAVLGPWLRRRAGNRPLTGLVAVASVWVGVSMAAACAATGLPWICAALALCAPAEIAWFIAASHTLNRITPPDRRGLYQGVWGASLATASLTAPLLGTWCLTSGGSALLIAANVGAGALGAVLCLPLGRDAARGAPGRSA